MTSRAAVMALVLMAPGIAAAQQQRAPAQAARPDSLGQQIERNMRTCVGTSRDVALVQSCMDGQRAAAAPRLARAVERLLDTQQDPQRRAALADVQAAWQAYRDRRCDFAGSNAERGAEAAGDRSACLLQFDVSRIMEIEAQLDPPSPPQRQQQRR